ncbi:hypothetical protein VTK26DRAFT_7748 [Humicola hyalothermophila]
MRFCGDMEGSTSLAHHCNIFAHPKLQLLTIDNYPDKVDDWLLLPLRPWGCESTSLKILRVAGVDVMTLTHVLMMPCALETLELEFTSATTTALEYAWGRFVVLKQLRVHQDHIFPAHRVWPMALHHLLPASLEKLIIHGCQFGDGGNGEDALERSLLRLAKELGEGEGSHQLQNIDLVLAENSPPAPRTIAVHLAAAGVALRVMTAWEHQGWLRELPFAQCPELPPGDEARIHRWARAQYFQSRSPVP